VQHAAVAALDDHGIDLAAVDGDVGEEPAELILALDVEGQRDGLAADQRGVEVLGLGAVALGLGGRLGCVDHQVADAPAIGQLDGVAVDDALDRRGLAVLTAAARGDGDAHRDRGQDRLLHGPDPDGNISPSRAARGRNRG
jgi:hypothetical protein